MSNIRLHYRKKVTQVLNQIDKIEFQTYEGERLEKYEADYALGDLYSENKIEIAQKILSIAGINAPKNFDYYKDGRKEMFPKVASQLKRISK